MEKRGEGKGEEMSREKGTRRNCKNFYLSFTPFLHVVLSKKTLTSGRKEVEGEIEGSDEFQIKSKLPQLTM